jgi:hypothetical protein
MSVHVLEKRPRHRGRRWAAATLRDLAYDSVIAIWGFVCLAIVVAGVSVTASLLVFVVGAAVWVAFSYATRAATSFDRRLAAWQRGEPVPASYRRPPKPGFLPMLKTVSSDRQTWRDLAWLAVNSVVGSALGLLALVSVGVAGVFLSIPIRYWATGPIAGYGSSHTLAVDTSGKALLAGAVGLAALPLAVLVGRACAAGHSALTVRFLAPVSFAPPAPRAEAALIG